jgi:hypothetical protein
MKKKINGRFRFITGFLFGAVLFGGVGAFAASVIANPTTSKVYVNGSEVAVTAYNIGDSNYFKLRDIGQAVDFAVTWDGDSDSIFIDATKPYTPETATAVAATPTPNETPVQTTTPNTEIPGGTAVDYSQQANPAIFIAPPGNERVSTWNADGTFDKWLTYEEYKRQEYNEQRQKVIDTGEIATGWGRYTPANTAAIEAANQFADSLNGLSDIEKITRINEFLCEHLEYKSDAEYSGNDFWTGMAYGICEQYSQTVRYMCYRVGLPCLYIGGNVKGNVNPGEHAWNEIYIDGKWQHYDGTFSDGSN